MKAQELAARDAALSERERALEADGDRLAGQRREANDARDAVVQLQLVTHAISACSLTLSVFSVPSAGAVAMLSSLLECCAGTERRASSC
jgi:hypothetical protein